MGMKNGCCVGMSADADGMKTNITTTLRRSLPVFAQLGHFILPGLVDRLASDAGIKLRVFSYTHQLYSLAGCRTPFRGFHPPHRAALPVSASGAWQAVDATVLQLPLKSIDRAFSQSGKPPPSST
jgi:hypothetical protein